MPSKSPTTGLKVEKQLKTLGAQIRAHRKALGISSTAAAESAGMSRTTLYRIECGEASVTMGAYLEVLSALNFKFEIVDKNQIHSKLKDPPQKINISQYPQLKKLAWQLRGEKNLNPKEALDLYERNWRHLDTKKLNSKEKALIKNLLNYFGRKRLLV